MTKSQEKIFNCAIRFLLSQGLMCYTTNSNKADVEMFSKRKCFQEKLKRGVGMIRVRNIFYYLFTLFFGLYEKCYAWRYSDDYDYDGGGHSLSLFACIIYPLGFISFYFFIKNIICFFTKGKVIFLAKTTPILLYIVLFNYDMLGNSMKFWGVTMGIVLLSESSEDMWEWVGQLFCGLLFIVSLFVGYDGNLKGMFFVDGSIVIAHAIMYVDRKLNRKFINFLTYSPDE